VHFWKKIATYDCIIFGKSRYMCPIIETAVFLGRQISHLEAIESMGF